MKKKYTALKRSVIIFSLLLSSFSLFASVDSSVWIWEKDGTKQCENIKPVSLLRSEKRLKKAKIDVYKAVHTNDGMMHAQVCGAATGGVNAFYIRTSDLPIALKIPGITEAIKGFNPSR